MYQDNRFGPLRAGAGGNNLKDRSAGLVVRYNWIEGGNRQLDLVDAEDSDVLVNDPSYGETFVYGNVLIEPDGAGNSQIVHYGGDSGDDGDLPQGHRCTSSTTRSSRCAAGTRRCCGSRPTTRAPTCATTWSTSSAPGDRLAMLDADGVLALSHNWTKPGWVASHGGLSGVIDDDGTGVEGASPGFVGRGDAGLPSARDVAGRRRRTALCIRTCCRTTTVVAQYREHQMHEPRPDDGAPDLGAFELPEPGVGTGLAAGLVTLGALSRHRSCSRGRSAFART